MKFHIFLLYIIVLSLNIGFHACKPKQEEAQTTRVNRLIANDSARVNIKIPEITSYLKFLQQTDRKDIQSAGHAINTFITVFSNSDSAVCDSAYIHFQQFADSVELYQNQELEEDTTDYSIIFTGGKVPKKISGYIINLNKNGFRLQLSDSVPIVILDRKFIADKFESLISVQLKNYLYYLDDEYKTGFAEADSIIITPFKLVDRILWYENFNQNHPDFVFRKECENHLKAYTTYLVSGFGKTKFFENEDKFIVSAYFIQAFEYLFNKNAKSITAQKLSEVNSALKSASLSKLFEARKNLAIRGIIFNIPT